MTTTSVSCPTLDEMNAMTADAYKSTFPKLCAFIISKMNEEAEDGYDSVKICDMDHQEIPQPDEEAYIGGMRFNAFYRPLLEEWFKDSGLEIIWGDNPEKISLWIRWGVSVGTEVPK